MTDLSKLRELAERLSAAEGPDREIDAAIALALFDIPGREQINFPVARIELSKVWSNYTIDIFPVGSDCAPCSFEPPAYTASIAAAVALVERILPSAWWVTARTPEKTGRAVLGHETVDEHEATASTPALALVTALVRAKIAQEQQTPGEFSERKPETEGETGSEC